MCPAFKAVWELLDNASVAAFVGAFCAFGLVVLTDWLRNKRKAFINLPGVLKRERLRAIGQRGVFTRLQTDANSGHPAPAFKMRFTSKIIYRFAEELSSKLSERQQMGLHNIADVMEHAEDLIDGGNDKVSSIIAAQQARARGEATGFEHLAEMRLALDKYYSVEITLLVRVERLIDAYLVGTLNEYGDISAGEPALP